MRPVSGALWRAGLLALVAFAASPLSAAAQQTRAALIDQARNEFDEAAAMAFLLTAVSEDAGGVDSLWTVAVHEVASALLRQGDQTQAALWLRLAARHGAEWPIDVDGFAPPVVALYRQSVPTGQSVSEVGIDDAPTRWQFPGRLDGSALGGLVVTSSVAGVPLEVSVSGQRQADAENGLRTRAGSYDLTVTSPGYDTVRVVREVLPAVTTSLQVTLRPVLADAVQEQVLGSIVRIVRPDRPGVCTTGFVAHADGWVLTEFGSLRGQDSVIVSSLGDATVRHTAQVSLFDEARNVAVLKLPLAGLRPLPSDAVSAGPVWAPHYVDCAAPAAVPLPLAENTQAAGSGGPLLFGTAAPAAALGAPIIDRGGSLVGIVVDDLAGLRTSQIGDLVERARARIAEETEQVVVRGGGGGNWKWIAAGLAAAGGVVFALTGGEGGGGSSGPPGTITISVP